MKYKISIFLFLCGLGCLYYFGSQLFVIDYLDNTKDTTSNEKKAINRDLRVTQLAVEKRVQNSTLLKKTNQPKDMLHLSVPQIVVERSDLNRIRPYNPAREAYRTKKVKSFTEYYEKDTRQSEWAVSN